MRGNSGVFRITGIREYQDTMAASKKTVQRQGFKTNEFIVYPAHGVGQIVAIEEQEVAGHKLELFVINFAQDKLTLRVPVTKIESLPILFITPYRAGSRKAPNIIDEGKTSTL